MSDGGRGSSSCFPIAAALAVAFAAQLVVVRPVSAQLTLSINNRSCADLDVSLADAPGCAPGVPGCSVEARKGFTTKLVVHQPYRPGYMRLAAQGECLGRNTKLAGECLIRIKTVYQRVPGLSVYRGPDAYMEGQSAGGQYGSPFYDLEFSVPALPTLVTVDIYQGICDVDAGMRICELICRSDDQQ